MKKKIIKLANVVLRDRTRDDKIYMDKLQIVIADFPFATRQVILRFVGGPALDFAIVDMDRLAIEYLKMRGCKLPADVRDLTKAEAPPRADFVVPSRLMANWPRPSNENRAMASSDRGNDRSLAPGSSNRRRGKTKVTNGSGHRRSKKAKDRDEKLCGRCGQIVAYSGDWYGDLCPGCADKTDGDWVCHGCGRSGNFEVNGRARSCRPSLLRPSMRANHRPGLTEQH